jgi:hypothetical protein
MPIRFLVASVCLLACADALAATATSGSDAGPFPPRADPVLNGPVPPVIAPAFKASSDATMTRPLDAATIAALTRDADAKRIETAAAESELERAERIAREERRRAAAMPALVAPGAWNGETDPRTR